MLGKPAKMEHVLLAPRARPDAPLRLVPTWRGQQTAARTRARRPLDAATAGPEAAQDPGPYPRRAARRRPPRLHARREPPGRRAATRTQGQRRRAGTSSDLCDAGSFIEYGQLAVAAQARRRSMEDLIANTPADGMVTGIGAVNGAQCGEEPHAPWSLAY